MTGAAVLVAAGLGAATGSTNPATGTQVMVAGPSVPAEDWADELADLREQRTGAVSRATDRLALAVAPPTATPSPTPVAVVPLPATTVAYATIAVNVRAAASKDSPALAVLEPGSELAVTGRTAEGYAEVVHAGALAWVYAAYVAATPPTATDAAVAAGISTAACPSGSAVESGLTANAIAVHRAVCALFPEVTSYGGLRPGDGGEHGSGRALDIMISSDVGTQIAEYLRANAAALGVSELIWRQRIWSTQRAGDGWRSMEDRGSATANHYDHVHVTVH